MARRRRPQPEEPVRGTVHPLLDLHGLRGEEARQRAERWMRDRQAEGVRTVVLVTGRGNRSPLGLPVLLGEIEHLLDGLAGGLVASFEHTEGGGGFRVQLRRAPGRVTTGPPDRDRRALEKEFDADLLRRAEEALWELGITATPALIRAEAQRILAGEG
jgi:hypothetical protein